MTRCKALPKLPKRCETLTSKVRKDDPWRRGEELAAVIEQVWPALTSFKPNEVTWNNSQYTQFIHYFAALPELSDWGKKHFLSPYHVASTVVEEYL